ncbi:LLM class flavin-dependent oxidoreductase [Mycetocola tolaasinivorans]|uniref:LLM class flavin-dependent oxidoreductase n=1 Tax=Mycetocola tolaasinivorans TaxID=76635 RepID=A0A3L7A5C9_9MICO|nr:LLM class flavin-dependent oxidoreductase [Mycetocola tolaasinivorans]RLP75533.1 LLM class flavin-dependent oxidoreductase [Mycetocola tolaasinivorans]
MSARRLGFLSFGHHQNTPGASARTAGDALRQGIEIAVGAEELGLDGAWSRVHHLQRQFSSPWSLLAAIAARTSRIEIGTAVIDMRYENPLLMAELAASADLISNSRLQLGLSRGSQEPARRGYERFGFHPREGENAADMAREHTEAFRAAIVGASVAETDPGETGVSLPLSVEPHSPTLGERIWWGSATRHSAQWAGEQDLNLLSSTLLSEDTGIPFSELQAEQIRGFHAARSAAGYTGNRRVAVVRSILPIVSQRDSELYGAAANASREQVGVLGGAISRFGKSFIGAPDRIIEELTRDAAVMSADTLLVAIPNILGVDHNLRLLETIRDHIVPAIGWERDA